MQTTDMTWSIGATSDLADIDASETNWPASASKFCFVCYEAA